LAINITIGILLTSIFSAISVKLLGGNTFGGFAAGAIYGILRILEILPEFLVFRFYFLVFPIVRAIILMVLIKFFGKLDFLRAIASTIIVFVVGSAWTFLITPYITTLIG